MSTTVELTVLSWDYGSSLLSFTFSHTSLSHLLPKDSDDIEALG